MTMNKFFYYYDSLCMGTNTPTAFSYDPYVIAIKDLLFSEIQQIVYYIEKLRDFGIDMSEYTDKVIDFISVIIVNLDFNKESFFIIAKDLNENKQKLAKLYSSTCEKESLTPEFLIEEPIDYSTKDTILKALNDREKNLKSYSLKLNISDEKKTLYQIMINLVLNACNCLIELKTYGCDYHSGKDKVLNFLNTVNFPSLSSEDIISTILNFSKCNYEIVNLLYKNITEKYGPVVKNEVPCSIYEGKSILVSGSSFVDLEKILKAVCDLNINVYVHQELISAFQYQKFLKYPNLVGFYKKSNNNFYVDFESFKGSIYVSRNSIPKVDVIRGRIYTSMKYPSYGISKIRNNDFSPLIESALSSQGFISQEIHHNIEIGYSLNYIETQIENILSGVKNNQIRHVFIIGLNDKFSQNTEYVEKFFEEYPDDCYVISFSGNSIKENFLRVNSFFDFAILYKIIEKFKDSIDNYQEKLSVSFLDCNSSTLSHIFNLLYLKIKKIYIGSCCPNIINPLLLDGLQNIFDIKKISFPQKDIKLILDK